MLVSSSVAALLDANILYPAPLRDYLLRLAATGLYKPHWTATIHEEWIINLLKNRPDISRDRLETTKNAMIKAFPNANIEKFERFAEGLSLPDRNDHHVLAAAIQGKINVIVTNNIKDFPARYLKTFNIEASDADNFVLSLFNLNKDKCLEALNDLVNSLKNPPLRKNAVLSILEKRGLSKSVAQLKISIR